MMLAQGLYEGKEIGADGATGLITYMRTDSTRVSDDAIAEVRSFITERYGENFVPKAPNVYKTKKDAQDAHEAIRPTHPEMSPEMVARYLSDAELRLYRLIWQRFVASQMMPAVFDTTTVEIDAKSDRTYNFRLSGSVLKFDGFLKVYEDADEEGDDEQKLPALESGQALSLAAPDALQAAAVRQRDARRAEARRQYELKKAKIEARAEDQEIDEVHRAAAALLRSRAGARA
jgi:DNA topoisomerase-1